MGTYRVDWDCCGSVSETESWEPEHCPFCAGQKLRAEIDRLTKERNAAMELENRAMWNMHAVMDERDAALAEIERLKGERDRLYDREATMAKDCGLSTFDDLAPLRADIERLREEKDQAASAAQWLAKDVNRLRTEIERLRAENDQAISDAQTLEQEAHQLYNVLAVIHRDGGHYAHEHGAIKASEDAINEVIRLRSEIKLLLALVIEASEWSAYPHEDSEYGFRHCCGTEDFKPHTDECRFAIRALKEER